MSDPATWLALGGLLLWLPTVGYYLALEAACRMRRDPRPAGAEPGEWPPVAIVLPVLDEAGWIDARLRDFARADYPAERLELVVVDGGSRDGTVARVEAAAAADARVRLLRVESARAKMEQLRLAFEKTSAPIVVVSDADVAMAPGCLRELVRALEADPGTALVGAHLEPRTELLEERLHWWLLDRLWWLEGDLLGAAGVAAPCYALRPEAVRDPLPPEVTADDVHLALVVGSRGWRVRRRASARAEEQRVPRTWPELLHYRHRRGGGFAHEVATFAAPSAAPGRFRWMLRLRRFQLLVAPRLALALVLLAPALDGWRGLLALAGIAVAFGLPLLAAVFAAPAFARERRPVWRLPAACARLAAANGLALLWPGRGRNPASRASAHGRAP
jgi:cellulose synthase/poly-beta-1,6-N-acetylglucosamine synthase-like glycosyltransferase